MILETKEQHTTAAKVLKTEKACKNMENVKTNRMNAEAITHYLKLITSVTEVVKDRIWLYNVGDNFRIEVIKCPHDLKDKNDLMNLWKKHGYIKETMSTHICINTYFTDCNNNCYSYYNITEKPSDDGKRREIDFDYLWEFTPENVNELIAECIRLYKYSIMHQIV